MLFGYSAKNSKKTGRREERIFDSYSDEFISHMAGITSSIRKQARNQAK